MFKSVSAMVDGLCMVQRGKGRGERRGDSGGGQLSCREANAFPDTIPRVWGQTSVRTDLICLIPLEGVVRRMPRSMLKDVVSHGAENNRDPHWLETATKIIARVWWQLFNVQASSFKLQALGALV